MDCHLSRGQRGKAKVRGLHDGAGERLRLRLRHVGEQLGWGTLGQARVGSGDDRNQDDTSGKHTDDTGGDR